MVDLNVVPATQATHSRSAVALPSMAPTPVSPTPHTLWATHAPPPSAALKVLAGHAVQVVSVVVVPAGDASSPAGHSLCGTHRPAPLPAAILKVPGPHGVQTVSADAFHAPLCSP